MATLRTGFAAEQRACAFLEAKGLKLLQRNFHCAFGEIDLIMQDRDEIVFVEVRSRTHPDFETAIESITPAKQRKIIKTAINYLQKQNWFDKVQTRFDIIAISFDDMEWLKDAFSDDFS